MVLELLQASRSSQKTSANLIRGQPSIKIGCIFFEIRAYGCRPCAWVEISAVHKEQPACALFSVGRSRLWMSLAWNGWAGHWSTQTGALLNEWGFHARSLIQYPNVLRRRSQVGFTTKLSTLYLDVCEAKRPTQVFPAEKWATNTLQCRRYFQEDRSTVVVFHTRVVRCGRLVISQAATALQ